MCVWVGAAINKKLNTTDETVFGETDDKTLAKFSDLFSRPRSSDSSPKLLSNSANMPPVVAFHYASAIPKDERVETTPELSAPPFRIEKDLGNEYFLHKMDVSLQEDTGVDDNRMCERAGNILPSARPQTMW